jgi:hypothetical protein
MHTRQTEGPPDRFTSHPKLTHGIVASSTLCPDRLPCEPTVFRGLARDWPAHERWTFPHLASMGTGVPVRLVLGNRECHATRFADSTLGAYLAGIETGPHEGEPAPYLKEFGLLRLFPALHDDLRLASLYPAHAWVWNDVWIGPPGSRTGLHKDRLDNIGVLVRGRKRFRLAAPGSIEAMGAVSPKYDRVSVMATRGLDERPASSHRFATCEVVMEAGDALYTPAGWWHEVDNLEASIFVGGFFGGKLQVTAQWLSTLPKELLHRAGLWRKGNCVCHP